MHTRWAHQLLDRKPKHWKRMLSLYSYLADSLTFKRQSALQYSFDRQIPHHIAKKHLTRLNRIILVSLIIAVGYNSLVTFIETMNLIECIQITHRSGPALFIQTLWFLNFKYVYNFDSEGAGVNFLLMYTSIADFELRFQSLNIQVGRLIFELRNDSIIESTRLVSRVSKIGRQFSQLADEQLFANQMTSLLVSNLYVAGVVVSVAYFFLIYLGDHLLVSRQFLIISINLLSFPLLLPPCWFGQLLIDQVTRGGHCSYNVVQKPNKTVSFKGKRLQTNVHSMMASSANPLPVRRKLFLSLELLGHKHDALVFHVLHFAEYSLYTFLKVSFCYKCLMVWFTLKGFSFQTDMPADDDVHFSDV